MSTPTTPTSLRRVRTRIAPSPTGFLHLGTARTALFSWAFARHFGGDFILRIEDTDVARSTQEAVDQIIAAMRWLELGYDEGPFYQMQRLDRYRVVIAGMLAAGTAYHCYCQPAELDAMREAQRARGDKPRYDGRWRPEPGKQLPAVPSGLQPVVRFRNPTDGEVTWDDLVKGPITIGNRELDDLIIARPDGTPTYNFCVVVDDWDMQISHVIRGDDHVNNTPRQINILRALGAELPLYGHVPMILGPDGDKLSKRHGAVSVMQYQEAGYLPEAMPPSSTGSMRSTSRPCKTTPSPSWSPGNCSACMASSLVTTACPVSAHCSRTVARPRWRWRSGPPGFMPMCARRRPSWRNT